jgi:hypothetical protein
MKTKNCLARILLLAPRNNTTLALLENLKFLNYEVSLDPKTCGPVDLIIRDAHQNFPSKELHFDAPILIVWDREESRAELDLSGDRCLFTPFTVKELEYSISCVLQKMTSQQEAPKEDSCAAGLVRVHVSDFQTGKDFHPEAFVKTVAGEFVSYPTRCSFSEEEIGLFLKEGITALYVRKSDYQTLLGLSDFYLYLADPALKSRKINFFGCLGRFLQEEVVLKNLNPSAFEHAKITLEAALSTLMDNKEVFELLEIMLYRHPEKLRRNLRVTLCSILMAQHLSDSSQQTFFILTASGLFHDLGFLHKLLAPHKTFETSNFLESLRAIPREAITVICEPRHPFANVLSLSRIIESQVLEAGQNLELWLQRLRVLMRDYLSGIDSGLVAALGRTFHMDLKGSL